MKRILTLLTVLLFTISCATPTIVNVIGPNDSEFSCKELSAEIAKANKYSDDAQKQKKAGNPTNIGALIFFLPGYGMTVKNVEEASKAAKERAVHLNGLKDKKNC